MTLQVIRFDALVSQNLTRSQAKMKVQPKQPKIGRSSNGAAGFGESQTRSMEEMYSEFSNSATTNESCVGVLWLPDQLVFVASSLPIWLPCSSRKVTLVERRSDVGHRRIRRNTVGCVHLF